jgi:hypothetical protein
MVLTVIRGPANLHSLTQRRIEKLTAITPLQTGCEKYQFHPKESRAMISQPS